MFDAADTITTAPDPLQAIRDDVQQRKSETRECADRQARRADLMQRLMERFRTLVSCAAPLLAAEHLQQGESFCPDLARSLWAFNPPLGEPAQEYPRYRIRERLSRAARAGVPALDTATSLLLKDPGSDPAVLAVDLERLAGSRFRTTSGRFG